MQAAIPRRSSTFTSASFSSFSGDLLSDSRFHGYQGPTRNVRLLRATTSAGGTVAKSEDGVRCVVAGRESLRVLRLLDPEDTSTTEQKLAVGRGGHRIDVSKNLWDGSGLKVESTSTDVAWCSGNYNNKILTSAKNGDLIMWDLDKAGSMKYERKSKNHIRSIHQLCCSTIVPYYCITGSADGDIRIWDLRDMSRSVMRIHHPTSVRSLVFSPNLSHPLQAVVGLDNGSIYRWDLQMGQRGQLDRLPVAHTGPILTLDWCSSGITNKGAENLPTQTEHSWIVSGGLDHAVKVWDLPGASTASHIVNKPTYVLHPSYPVRRVLWRPDYPCELALVSNAEFSGSSAELLSSPRIQNATPSLLSASVPLPESKDGDCKSGLAGDTVEIWDVRRGWIAKWTVDTNVSDGGVSDAVFHDSHALWVQHASGTFAQIDLRHSHRPIDAVPRVALSWNAAEGALAFVAGKRGRWEVPYDDVHPDRRSLLADRKRWSKGLGDSPRVPGLQNMGMYVRASPPGNSRPDLFVRLAKGYIVPEKTTKKVDVCSLNAAVAIRAGNVHAAQAWILLGSLLTDIVPESISHSLASPSKTDPPYPLVHAAPAPGALPSHEGSSVHSPSSQRTPYRALSAEATAQSTQTPLQSPSQSRISHHVHHTHSPRSASVNGAGSAVSPSNEDRKQVRHRAEVQPPPPTKPPPNSRNLTPASSASSSPRHLSQPLPPMLALPPSTTMTPTTVVQKRPSILVPTTPLPHTHNRRPSVYTRVGSAQSESPSAASMSDKSHRHVGEGALDDSDSSDGMASESVADSHASEVDHIELSCPPRRPSLSKARSMSAGRPGPAHPSPLSRLAGQQHWTEDEDEVRPMRRSASILGRVEDEEASPSPVSTDTDDERSDNSEGGGRHRVVMAKPRTRSRKNSNARRFKSKSRSRSSTVASLTPGLLSPPRASRSVPPLGSPKYPHVAILSAGSASSVETVIAVSIREQESETIPEDTINHDVGEKEPASWTEMSHRRRVMVVEEECQIRELGWRALREALEEYADEGDVQMCGMLALVAPDELKLSLGRTTQFIEAYIDMLMRHRLHACAAYLRKYCRIEEVERTTRLETVVYTACRKCRKPIVAIRSRNPFMKATYAVCATCKEAVAKCSICHLPVRTLLFRCSVCSHGGHQECYRRFYMDRPMVGLPAPVVARGRQMQREQDGEKDGEEGRSRASESTGERSIAGHPCAAGCGHFCWAAVTQRSDDRRE